MDNGEPDLAIRELSGESDVKQHSNNTTTYLYDENCGKCYEKKAQDAVTLQESWLVLGRVECYLEKPL